MFICLDLPHSYLEDNPSLRHPMSRPMSTTTRCYVLPLFLPCLRAWRIQPYRSLWKVRGSPCGVQSLTLLFSLPYNIDLSVRFCTVRQFLSPSPLRKIQVHDYVIEQSASVREFACSTLFPLPQRFEGILHFFRLFRPNFRNAQFPWLRDPIVRFFQSGASTFQPLFVCSDRSRLPQGGAFMKRSLLLPYLTDGSSFPIRPPDFSCFKT